jgi:phage terminase small subunit
MPKQNIIPDVKDLPEGKKKLDVREKRFVEEFLISASAVEAAINAGYSPGNVHAGVLALKKPHVARAIAEGLERQRQKARVTQEMIVEEYKKIAFLDPTRFFDKSGNLVPIYEMQKECAAALSGFDINRDDDGKVQLTKIRFSDKKAALDSLARHLGMFIDKREISGPDGKPILIAVGSGYPDDAE